MLGLHVADATSGFRVYSRRALESIEYDEVMANGYAFQIEMTYRARRSGNSIIVVPISFADSRHGTSKISSAIIRETLGLVTRWKLKELRQPRDGRAQW
jgi:dolichol-phosphate mannosyltransferase